MTAPTPDQRAAFQWHFKCALKWHPYLGFDIIAFDDWLHLKHGNYEDEHGWSMRELLEEKYGRAAAKLIESFLKP